MDDIMKNLKFGVQKKVNIPEKNVIVNEIKPTRNLFPECENISNSITKLKKHIFLLVKKLSKTEEENNQSIKVQIKLKQEQFEKLREELFTTLNLQVDSCDNFKENSNLLPLVSFKQISSHCNLLDKFCNIIEHEYNFKVPSPIQSCVIPFIFNNHNIIATSSTGSGKTLAYIVPIVASLLMNKNKGFSKKALLILPTKELVTQIFNDFNYFCSLYCENNKIKSKLIKHDLISSVNSTKENFNLFIDNNDIFIGTPENINLLVNESCDKYHFLKKLKFIVFDEADKMFEKGFNDTVQKILNTLFEFESKKIKKLKEKYDNKQIYKKIENEKINKCFFSATISTEILEYLKSQIIDIKKISIGNNLLPCSSVKQKFIYCTNLEGKIFEIKKFLGNVSPPVLVFCDSIESGKSLFEKIRYEVPKINLLHSQMKKESREELIKKLRIHDIWILITSDLIARGLDFKNIKTVINFDCPESYVTYIHRVGRTGRAGNEGNSLTLITDEDRFKLKNLKEVLNHSETIDCPNWMKKV